MERLKMRRSSGSLINYKYETKNLWRETIWDEISTRIKPDRGADSIILYLAGEQDLDREHALRRGFRANNIIAIELCEGTVQTLRKEKKIVIHSDIKDLMEVWPANLRIGVVFADFCQGIDFRLAYRMAGILFHFPFREAIFAFNFQRGREQNFDFWMEVRSLDDDAPKTKEFHRGKLFIEDLREIVRPRYFSYKSTRGNLIFDSVVFQSPFIEISKTPRSNPLDTPYNQLAFYLMDWADVNEKLFNEASSTLSKRLEKAKRDAIRRKISACLAVRTKYQRKGVT